MKLREMKLRVRELSEAERATIIAWSAEGWWVSDIARIMRLTPMSVRKWIKRFNAAGLEGLKDQPRSGRPATYTAEQIGEVVAVSLLKPDSLGLPFGCWTLDRLEAFLNEERGLPIKRSRIDEVLIAEGLRWRTQETWFGERATLAPDEDRQAAPLPIKVKKEREVDPDFAQKRGSSPPSIRRL